MLAKIRIVATCGAGLFVAAGFMISRAQDTAPNALANVISPDIAAPADSADSAKNGNYRTNRFRLN